MTAAIAVASLSGLGLVLATRPAERPVSPG
jgi:hypothetical protein